VEGSRRTHHPGITPTAPVDQPSRDLARSLYDEQAAESLAELEEGSRPSQHPVPGANRHGLRQPIRPKYPLSRGRVARSLSVKGPLDPSTAIVCIHREAVQAPDQQRGQDEPLRPSDGPYQRVAETTPVGRGEPEDGVEKVESSEREGVGEAAGSAADVEGDGYGRDDRGQEDHRAEDACKPHSRREAPNTPGSAFRSSDYFQRPTVGFPGRWNGPGGGWLPERSDVVFLAGSRASWLLCLSTPSKRAWRRKLRPRCRPDDPQSREQGESRERVASAHPFPMF
jgi:hypothetical protein